MLIRGTPVAVAIAMLLVPVAAREPSEPALLRFEISADPAVPAERPGGRVFVVLSREASPEPRLRVGETGFDAPVVLGKDVDRFASSTPAIVDRQAVSFPIDSLDRLAAARYHVQAVFDTNIDLRSVNAPGNLYSDVTPLDLDPRSQRTVSLRLSRKVPAESMPPESEYVRYVRLRSTLLSDFHRRPIFLRAGVILPRGFGDDPMRRYPLRVRIGGYGDRYTKVADLMRPGSEFRDAWLSQTSPRMLLVHLDGDGPFGDPYQVNSDNNGPYGDAITQELIPYIEKTFRGRGVPEARVLDGGSTGGWVSLALQVFYPDYFNGAWSHCPDSVDFRAFQLIDIYSDANAYLNAHGFERPAARDINGDVRFTIRHECQMENVLGAGDGWQMSGEQWGAWNAAYGPRGPDGRPVPLWDPRSGALRRDLTEHWKRYDLRLVLEKNWATLAPKLRGRIKIWIGDADTYFLNNAVHLLDQFFLEATPRVDASIEYGPRQGHCWWGLSEVEIMTEMGRQTRAE